MKAIRAGVLSGLLMLGVGSARGRAATFTISVHTPDPAFVGIGDVICADVRATFDQTLTACAFHVEFAGSAAVVVESRVLGPIAANGMTILSPISQSPFVDSLPHPADAGPLRETIFDDVFGGQPGGASDGVSPGTDVLIERFSIRALSPGPLNTRLTHPSAATTQGAPNGALFDVIQIDPAAASVSFTVCGGADCNANGVADNCDLVAGTSRDCNANAVPDECDIAAGTSQDSNHDGVPDECVQIVSANPPTVNPYNPALRFRDVLQNTTTALAPQGVGLVGTPAEGPITYAPISVTFSATPVVPPTQANVVVSCTDSAANGPADCPAVASISGSGAGPYHQPDRTGASTGMHDLDLRWHGCGPEAAVSIAAWRHESKWHGLRAGCDHACHGGQQRYSGHPEQSGAL